MGGVLTMRLNASSSVEVVACPEHGAEIEAGAPYRLDMAQREPAIVMGAELASFNQWEALRFGVKTDPEFPHPLLHVTAQRLGTDETQEIELALNPLARHNLSQSLGMFEAVGERGTTAWQPLPGR